MVEANFLHLQANFLRYLHIYIYIRIHRAGEIVVLDKSMLSETIEELSREIIESLSTALDFIL